MHQATNWILKVDIPNNQWVARAFPLEKAGPQEKEYTEHTNTGDRIIRFQRSLLPCGVLKGGNLTEFSLHN
jgi:hypothetical protein